MKLDKLQSGKTAVILRVESDLPLKLMEMGCVAGAEIEFLGSAPLGSPHYYKVGDTRIALGEEIVKQIEVQVENGG
jgi:ferrous iron transport protein A